MYCILKFQCQLSFHFISRFIQKILSTYYVPGMILSAEDTEILLGEEWRRDKTLAFKREQREENEPVSQVVIMLLKNNAR